MTHHDKTQRLCSEYTFVDFIKDFLKDVFFSILLWFLCKTVKFLIKKGFKTHRFVAFKINGRIASTNSQITLRVNGDTNILGLYKLGVVAPFYSLYYKSLLKIRSIQPKIPRKLLVFRSFFQ